MSTFLAPAACSKGCLESALAILQGRLMLMCLHTGAAGETWAVTMPSTQEVAAVDTGVSNACLRCPGSQACVVEEAEAHGSVALSMVPRRPHNCSAVGCLAPAALQSPVAPVAGWQEHCLMAVTLLVKLHCIPPVGAPSKLMQHDCDNQRGPVLRPLQPSKPPHKGSSAVNLTVRDSPHDCSCHVSAAPRCQARTQVAVGVDVGVPIHVGHAWEPFLHQLGSKGGLGSHPGHELRGVAGQHLPLRYLPCW